MGHVLAMINVLSLEYLEFFLGAMRLGGSLWKESSMSERKLQFCDITDIRSGTYDTMYDLSYMIHDTSYMRYMCLYIYTAYRCAHDI